MPEKTKSCPKCRGTMTFRLGEFECPQCGYSEAAQAPEPELKTSGPGFKQPWQQARDVAKASSPARQAPAPPPPGTMYTPGAAPQLPAGAAYSVYEPGPAPRSDSLELEKKIYLGISVGIAVLGFIGTLIPDPTFGATSFAEVGGYLLQVGINLLLIWFVLFTDALWAKWCCGGCTAVALGIALIGTLTMGTAISRLMVEQGFTAGETSVVTGVIWLVVIIWSLWHGWLLSIIWRDIQRLQGR